MRKIQNVEGGKIKLKSFLLFFHVTHSYCSEDENISECSQFVKSQNWRGGNRQNKRRKFFNRFEGKIGKLKTQIRDRKGIYWIRRRKWKKKRKTTLLKYLSGRDERREEKKKKWNKQENKRNWKVIRSYPKERKKIFKIFSSVEIFRFPISARFRPHTRMWVYFFWVLSDLL